MTRAATNGPAGAREDWQIVAAVAQTLGHALPYTTAAHVRGRLAEVAPHFALLNDRQVPPRVIHFIHFVSRIGVIYFVLPLTTAWPSTCC